MRDLSVLMLLINRSNKEDHPYGVSKGYHPPPG